MSPKRITVLIVLFTFKFLPSMASDPDPLSDYCIPAPNSGCKNSSEANIDDFVFSGMKTAGNFSDSGLASISINPRNFPGMNTLGISFVRADLKPRGINPPHFHPRATEMAYVMKGRVYAGFVDSENRAFVRVLEEGEVMVFPRGLLHFQMNVGKKDATIFESFNSQNPGMQKIGGAVFGSGIDNVLLERVFGFSPKQIKGLRRKFDPTKAK